MQVKSQKKIIEEKFKFPALKSQKTKVMVYVKSDCYKGLEVEVPLEFDIKKEPEKKRVIIIILNVFNNKYKSI